MTPPGPLPGPAPGTTPGPSATDLPRVVVAMLTYRRPAELARALGPLRAQVGSCTVAEAELMVVDNDPDGGARSVVQAAGGVRYVHEPRPGIAAARNAALEHSGDAAAIVFIDDDEIAGPHWLEHLVSRWREWNCAGVAGPAVRTVDGEPSEWIRRSGFFDRPDRPTGLRVAGAATNNVLLDLRVLRASGLRFDERFGLTGGSDTMLTRSLTQDGHEIRWCAEAEVLDPVPAERATRAWVLRRAYRTGTTWSRVHLVLRSRRPGRGPARLGVLARRLELSARACGRIATTVPALAGGLLRGSGPDPAAQCRAAGGLGMLSGAWGMAYVEYRRNPAGA